MPYGGHRGNDSASWDAGLPLSIALCILLPCCCFFAYCFYHRRQSSLDSGGWTGTPAMQTQRPWTPPVEYGYGDPRVPPNTPEVRGAGLPGMFPSGQAGYPVSQPGVSAYQGEPHRVGESASFEKEGIWANRPTPQVTSSPPPPDTQPSTVATMTLTDSGAHPVAQPVRETEIVPAAPGGATVPEAKPAPTYQNLSPPPRRG